MRSTLLPALNNDEILTFQSCVFVSFPVNYITAAFKLIIKYCEYCEVVDCSISSTNRVTVDLNDH